MGEEERDAGKDQAPRFARFGGILEGRCDSAAGLREALGKLNRIGMVRGELEVDGPRFAFTFGAMGSQKSNFYNNAFARQGWGDDVAEVQRLWIAGDREAAAARVPVEIGLRTNLIGSPDEIRRRLREYRDCGVNTLRVGAMGDSLDEQVAGLGQLVDLVGDVNAESA